MINPTPLIRPWFGRRCRPDRGWTSVKSAQAAQACTLAWLLTTAREPAYGSRHRFREIGSYDTFRATVPLVTYPDLRADIERMVAGGRDILWPGRCRRFAQSSGTSDGKSKYIPVTDASLRVNHYAGGADVVACYLNLYPDSRLFAGKSFILGGSFATEHATLPPGVRIGDLSANLIENINPLANLVRIPSKEIALMSDWTRKLPALVEASLRENVTNISGVPSWFLTVLREVIRRAGATTIHDVWPNLEVFFHGGIAFGPYRDQYRAITDPSRMRYLETYNASEGFFAVQDRRDTPGMLLLLDIGIFYEFLPLGSSDALDAIPVWQVQPGHTYQLIISSCNGLWRYAIGDTVRVESVEPLRISIAGRTKSFINAFGEELMVYNADNALADTCRITGASVANYTAAPVYADGAARGRHQWLIEWNTPPASVEAFADELDRQLQRQNSDYQAKRTGGIFLDRLSITTARPGLFDDWLASTGKLGGQRKVPRLANDRTTIEAILKLNTPKNAEYSEPSENSKKYPDGNS